MQTAVLTVPYGVAQADKAVFTTAKALDGSTRMVNTATSTTLSAADGISLTAPTVNLGTSQFTSSSASVPKMTVAGSTTTADLTAANIVADNVVTNSIRTAAPTDTLTVTAKKVFINADITVTGTLNAVNSQQLNVKDKIVKLGTSASTLDADRNGAGLVVAGAPKYLPAGKDAAQYEQSIKWFVNSGTFKPDGTAVEAFQRPAWTVSGGNLGIAAPDEMNRKATFFFAPYFTADTANLGLYYATADGQVLMVENFSTAVIGGFTIIN